MASVRFRFIVRTPHETVLETVATSVRLLTESGHVGLRPRIEPIVVPVETGLLLVHTENGVTLVGSAGGLLSSDGRGATLFTPLAVVGTDPVAVQGTLNGALAEPDSELAVRARLGKLEGRILTELRRDPHEPAPHLGERR